MVRDGGVRAGSMKVVGRAKRMRGRGRRKGAKRAEGHEGGDAWEANEGGRMMDSGEGAMIAFVCVKETDVSMVKVIEEGTMGGVGGKRVGRVMEVHIVMGNPARGMEFKSMSEFMRELGGNVGGDIRVKGEAIVKEGVLEMEHWRMGNGRRGRRKGRERAGKREEGKSVSDGVRPGISMAEGKGGLRGVRRARHPTRGKLMGVDVDEGKVTSTEDEDGIKPGGRRIVGVTREGERIFIGSGIKGGDIMDSSGELRRNSVNDSVMMRLEEGKQGGRGGGVRGGSLMEFKEMSKKASVEV